MTPSTENTVYLRGGGAVVLSLAVREWHLNNKGSTWQKENKIPRRKHKFCYGQLQTFREMANRSRNKCPIIRFGGKGSIRTRQVKRAAFLG